MPRALALCVALPLALTLTPRAFAQGDISEPPVLFQRTLTPFDDTPNNGGVYKAWVVRLDDFLAGCAALGVPNGLNVVDCGLSAGNFHGFIPRHTKTDNFKVFEEPPDLLVPDVVTQVIDNGSGADITNRTVSIVEGESFTVHDVVSVTGSGLTPTGDVTFDFFSNGVMRQFPRTFKGRIM